MLFFVLSLLTLGEPRVFALSENPLPFGQFELCAPELQKLKAGFDQVCKNPDRFPAASPELLLFCAVELGTPLSRALKPGLNPNFHCLGESPLNRAIVLQRPIIAELLNHGALADFLDSYCRLPASVAAQTGALETLKVFAQHGVDFTLTDGKFDVPTRGCVATAKYLDTPLGIAGYWGQAKAVEFLLTHGAQATLDRFDSSGFTPLMRAADGQQCPSCGDFTETVQVLLTHGADLRAEVPADLEQGGFQDRFGERQTALFFAAFRGRLESLKLLVEAGADVNHRSPNGFTALDGAAHSFFSAKEKVTYLCSKGARGAQCN